MSSSSRAMESGRRSRRIDAQPALGHADNSRRLGTICEPPALAQGGLGRECITQHLRLILPLALTDLAVLSVAFLYGGKLVAFASGVPLGVHPAQLAALMTTAIVLYGSLGLFQNRAFQPVDEFRQILLWSALSVILFAIVRASFAGLSLYENVALRAFDLDHGPGWTKHPKRDAPRRCADFRGGPGRC